MVITAHAQQSRYVVIDQDGLGPAGTDMNSMIVFLQSPEVKVLGITLVTGDGWRDEEVAHTLRMLELVGRTDVPVYAGAAHPLVRTEEWTYAWEKLYGKILYHGAWDQPPAAHPPSGVPPLPEGNPTTKAAAGDAADFLVAMVHKYPHQVTVYAAGPMTNIAQAISRDPHFAELAKELIIMGGSINPRTDDVEFADNPHHEFNLWFDPEASSITLHAHWAKIVATTVDVSIQTRMTKEIVDKIAQSSSPAAQYIARYEHRTKYYSYMWDELAAAAWLDPSLITRSRNVFMDVSLDKGISYGDTLVWTDENKPALDLQKVQAQMDVDWPKFQAFFERLIMAPTPNASNPLILAR
jgi:inosine-uridine nucleoside N-ribohydrolase